MQGTTEEGSLRNHQAYLSKHLVNSLFISSFRFIVPTMQKKRPFVCKPFSMDLEYLKDNVVQLKHRDQSLGDLDTLMEEETRVQEVPQDLTIRQHPTWWEAEETDVSHLPIKTENDEEPVDQTPGCSQDYACNTSCSFLKEEDVPLSPTITTAGVSCKAEPKNDTCQPPSFLPFASSQADGDGPLPNQPPSRRIRQRRRSLANTISAEMARNRRLTWDLARRSEAHLDRLIAIGERANAQREVDNVLRRESVIAVNQLATTVEGAISALHQFNELLDHSLNPGKS
ncbi:uncharacterized protein LOC141520488 [Macrotis lagotis]|uniref:uncharacterized protein LOC141520488 n=1 Tax=Macrotis lagotis TaxID=92651 RepID=UPI003D69BADE